MCLCMACCTVRVVLCTLAWHAALEEWKCVFLYGMLYWKSGTVCFSMACCIRRVEVCLCMACSTGRVVLCALVWHAALGEWNCVSQYGMLS